MKNLKKLSRNELKKVNGGVLDSNYVGLCTSRNSSCPHGLQRYVNAPDNGGFECCKP